jgi:hypothetical protein
MFSKLMSMFKKKKTKKPQSTFIYCDQCNNEMVSDGSFVSDTYDDNGDNHVLYCCKECGLESDWNFDIAPFPVLWNDIKAQAQAPKLDSLHS